MRPATGDVPTAMQFLPNRPTQRNKGANSMQIYNSMTRKKELFVPLHEGKVCLLYTSRCV